MPHQETFSRPGLDVSTMQRAAFLKTWTIQYLPCKELLFSKTWTIQYLPCKELLFSKTWTIQYLPCKELLFSKPVPYSVFHAKSCFQTQRAAFKQKEQDFAMLFASQGESAPTLILGTFYPFE
jgi:hypothetical protein